MTLALVLAIVLLPFPASALSLTIDGTLATGGSFTGSLSYDPSTPLATNVRGLIGNTTYQVSDWSVTVTPLFASLPQTVTMNTIELCQGNCIFNAPNLASVTMSDGLHTLRLAFTQDWLTPLYSDDMLKSFNVDGTFNSLITVNQVTVTDAPGGITVPEPMTWFLLIMGATFLYMVNYDRMGARNTRGNQKL